LKSKENYDVEFSSNRDGDDRVRRHLLPDKKSRDDNDTNGECVAPRRFALQRANALQSRLRCDETGLSSRFMLRTIASKKIPGLPVPGERSMDQGVQYPHDPGDFARCVGLLDAEPKLREHLHLMATADCGPQWQALVENWGEIEGLYREERPSGQCPKLYERMKVLLGE
jgi:hypothetical protein